jgi:peptide deformylase
MAVLPIVIGQDNPILRAKTKKVSRITKDLLKLIEDMKETTAASKGAGIAAPQVGRTERVCIAFIGKKFTPLINAEITWRSDTVDVAALGPGQNRVIGPTPPVGSTCKPPRRCATS